MADGDAAFIKAHVNLFPNPEHSPYKEGFCKAIRREVVLALSEGCWERAKDLGEILPDNHPLALLIKAVRCISKGRQKEAGKLLVELMHMEEAESLAPLITDLNGLLDSGHPDLDSLNKAIERTLSGEKPRPRMSGPEAKDLWTLFRLLYKPEKDGYKLPRTYWRDLEKCILNLKSIFKHEPFLDQVNKLVWLEKEMSPFLSADPDNILHILSVLDDDIRKLLIGSPDPPLPVVLEHLAQCVRVTCYRLLTQPGVNSSVKKNFADILIGLLNVTDTERIDLQKAMAAWNDWQSLIEDEEYEEIRHGLCEHRDRHTTSPHARFLIDLGIFNVAVQEEFDEEPIPDFFGIDDPSTGMGYGIDALDDAARTIALLPEQMRREAARIVRKKLKEIGCINQQFLRNQGEILLTLSEYLPRDGTVLLAGYAALRLSGSLKTVSRRTKKTLHAKKKSFVFSELQEFLLSLFLSTIEPRLFDAWEEIIVLSRELSQEQWPEIEKALGSALFNKWRLNNSFISNTMDFLPDFGDLHSPFDIAGKISELTMETLTFGNNLFENNPDILTLGVINKLINIPNNKRKFSAMDRELKDLSLDVKWRVAVFLGTNNVVGIGRIFCWKLAFHVFCRIVPGIPNDFDHWEKIISCLEDMEESIPQKMGSKFIDLLQLLIKKLTDVRARVNPGEMRKINDFIDRLAFI